MKFSSYHNFFRNFANPVRLGIILALEKKQLCVGELVKATGEEQSKVSHHLAMLAQCGIVSAKRKGKQKIYSLNADAAPVLALAERHVKKCKRGCKNAKNCLSGQCRNNRS
ncbi:MAG: metalloregulator ArsR/SmtB family transcription factor [Candidatus Micrarchaeota archaeon]